MLGDDAVAQMPFRLSTPVEHLRRLVTLRPTDSREHQRQPGQFLQEGWLLHIEPKDRRLHVRKPGRDEQGLIECRTLQSACRIALDKKRKNENKRKHGKDAVTTCPHDK